MGSPNSSLTDIRQIVQIPLKSNTAAAGGKGGGPALVQWTEVQHHPGLVCALCQVRNGGGGGGGGVKSELISSLISFWFLLPPLEYQ